MCTSYKISVDNRPHFLSTYVPGTVLMVFQISSHRILTSPLDGGLLLLLSPFIHKGIGPEVKHHVQGHTASEGTELGFEPSPN